MSCWYCPTEGLRVNFNEFRQRVLQAPRNGYGTAEIHVELGKLRAAPSEAEYTEAPASFTTI
jgi:hypothetical protein